MPTTLGLDLAKRTTWYAAVADGDRLIEDGKIPSKGADVVRIAKKFDPDVVLLEASSTTAWAVDALVDADAPVWPVHPGSLPSRKSRRRKTDRIDARLLVRLWRAGVVTKAWIPPPELRALRNLARARHRLASDRTKYRNRIHQSLNQDGTRIRLADVELEGGRLFSKRGRKLTLDKHPELAAWYRAQDVLSEEMKTLDDRIQQVVDTLPDAQRLKTIPGFGPITSLAVYSEVGDIDRFDSAEKLVAYFGLEPVIEQSGDTVKHLGISRKGPGWIRGLLTQAAWTHIRHAPTSHVTRKYKRLAKRVGKSRAIVATARRLAKVAYRVWRDQAEFDSTGRTPTGPCRPPAKPVDRVH